MSRLTPHDITTLFLALGTMLLAARVCAELAKRLHQPSVLGEIVAGVLLGPTVLGRIAPGLTGHLFPREGGSALFLDGFGTVAAALFLLVAGMEVELGRVWRQGKAAISVSFWGIVIPFALGFAAAWVAPRALGSDAHADRLIFSLFFATALSISSLPVIARTLIDLNLFRTDIGMVIIAAAIVQDLVGWIIFAVILGLMGSSGGHGLPIGATIALTLGFALVMLTVVRWLIHRALPWIQAHASWPAGVLGFALCIALFGAAFTEWIGVHAIFGTFMAGVAIGDSPHLRERTRATIDQFISFIFAPLFFASVGLKVDFVADFDPVLVGTVLVIASAGKILGAGLGAKLSGMGSREAWSIGYGMNARGAMEIVLGLLALEAGVIRERMFVALVVMALVTSMMSGPLIQRAMGRSKGYQLRDFLSARGFVAELRAGTRDAAIRELAQAVAPATSLPVDGLARAVLERERIVASGLAGGLAMPNARLDDIVQPVVAIGLSRQGLDFDAPDGGQAHIVCLVLIPGSDPDAQWGIMAEVGRTFASDEVRDRVQHVTSYTELLAALNWGEHHGADAGPRRGFLLAGAGPLARAVAKRLTTLGAPAWLVDMNRDHCLAAQREGLSVVQGSALRDVIMFQAHAFEAGALLALTPNAEVNAGVARLARDGFAVPQTIVLTGDPEAPHLRAPLGAAPALAVWDRWVAEGGTDWVTLGVGKGEPRLLSAFVAAEGPELVPLLVVRDDLPTLAHQQLEVREGDQVHALRRRHASLPPLERFERAALRALVADLPDPAGVVDAARRLSTDLAARLDDPPLAAAAPAAAAITPLSPWLSVARITTSRPQTFELALARVRHADPAQGTTALVVIASSEDEQRTHLAALAALAQRGQQPDAERRWALAGTPDELRALLLGAAPAPAGTLA